MADLMVHREAVFHQVIIRAVLDSGPGKPLFVSFKAKDAEWFSPEDSAASPDGWVRDFDAGTVQGELELFFSEEDEHVRAVRRSEEHTSELQSLRHLVCR